MRRHDWKPRLAAHVAAAARRPYAAGSHDCALFAAGAVEAVRGEDPAAGFRGRYGSKAAGFRMLARAGYQDLAEAVAATLDEIPPAFAAAGDVSLVADPEGGPPVLGVVQGEAVYVLREDGLGLVPRALMLRAFRA
jgi:hypothetical protein